MRVVYRFTTQNGKWDLDSTLPYGITPDARDRYGAVDIPGAGGATHIFVNAPAGTTVEFRAGNNLHGTSVIGPSGWINFPMFASSGYNTDRGERGPWEVYVNGIRVADGIGLPNGWHVSTFLVVGDGPVVRPPPVTDDELRAQVADLARKILALVGVLVMAVMLAGCEPVVLPAWYAPVQDHSLECIGATQGECSLSPLNTRGPM